MTTEEKVKEASAEPSVGESPTAGAASEGAAVTSSVTDDAGAAESDDWGSYREGSDHRIGDDSGGDEPRLGAAAADGDNGASGGPGPCPSANQRPSPSSNVSLSSISTATPLPSSHGSSSSRSAPTRHGRQRRPPGAVAASARHGRQRRPPGAVAASARHGRQRRPPGAVAVSGPADGVPSQSQPLQPFVVAPPMPRLRRQEAEGDAPIGDIPARPAASSAVPETPTFQTAEAESLVVATVVEEPPIYEAERVPEDVLAAAAAAARSGSVRDINGGGVDPEGGRSSPALPQPSLAGHDDDAGEPGEGDDVGFCDERDGGNDDGAKFSRFTGTTVGYCQARRSRPLPMVLVGALIVALIALAVALGVLLPSRRAGTDTLPRSNSTEGETNGQEPNQILTTTMTTMETTVVPLTSLSTTPSSSNSRLASVLDLLLSSNTSSPEDVAVPSSPQAKALQWIVEEDPLALDPFIEGERERLIQRYVLMVVHYALGGENWDDKSRYGTGEGECAGDTDGGWFGVKCNEEGLVTDLLLANNNLFGPSLPPEITSLSHLESLDMNSNAIEGALPRNLSALANLRFLVLFNNRIGGTIPTMPPLLNVLNLGANFMTGEIPSHLVKLDRLEVVDLVDNRLITTIPESLMTLTNLRSLKITQYKMKGAYLQGTIPTAIGNLRNLETLRMGNGYLVGPFPDQIKMLHKLVTLHLNDNLLTNTIPSSIGELQNLENCILDGNQFNGTIPAEMGNLGKLYKLYLHANDFVGSMPQTVCDLNLRRLSSDCENLTLPQEVECACCSDCCEDVVKKVLALGSLC